MLQGHDCRENVHAEGDVHLHHARSSRGRSHLHRLSRRHIEQLQAAIARLTANPPSMTRRYLHRGRGRSHSGADLQAADRHNEGYHR